VFLPPNLASLSVQCTGSVSSLRLIDGNGVTHMNISGQNPSGYCALPVGTPNQVWRVQASSAQAFGVDFGGAPMIMCPDEATALAIRASVDVLDDGTICYHKFQVRAHDLLEQYRAMNPASFVVTPPPFSSLASSWSANPARNSLLLGQYGIYPALPATLAEQNLDPESPWFGSIHTWHDNNGDELPQNPWVTYNRLNLTQVAPTLNLLTAIYSIDGAINPLYHNGNLRNRIIIAALQEMMMLREHESPEPIYSTYFGGMKAFTFGRYTRWFPWVIADCPSDVRSVLTDGMRRYVDHMALASVPQIGNQWSFIMLGLRNFGKGTGEQFYHEMLGRQITWLLTRQMHNYGAMPAGYIADGEGPDTSYSGILLHNFGWIAEDAGHAALKNALCESYELLNHTMALEPDGSWLGTSSFAHRTSTSWTAPGWGGGVAIMGDDCPDAGVLVGHTWLPWPIPRNATELADAQEQMVAMMDYHDISAYDDPSIGLNRLIEAPMIFFAAWEHFLDEPMPGQLPMKANNHFTRKFGSEFFCVRRQKYYAYLYCGKTLAAWREASKPTDPNVQYPRNGGGLSMFWSPKFGSSIIAENWSAYSSNSIIATLGDQTFFEDYWRVDGALQQALGRATIDGELNDERMSVRRQLKFLEDRITCETRLQPSQAVQYSRLSECFPYSLDKPDAITVTLHNANGQQVSGNNVMASAIVFRTTVNEVHVIAFNHPRRCDVGVNTSTDAYNQQRECGRVLTDLPPNWNANQVRIVKWAMKAVKPNQVQQTITQLVQSLQN
jgi:hypothetical protein